jgi:hypothetical protein
MFDGCYQFGLRHSRSTRDGQVAGDFEELFLREIVQRICHDWAAWSGVKP